MERYPNFDLSICKENLNDSINFLGNIIDNTNCKKFILSGSCLEYGNFSGECSEDDKINIINYFSWAKNALRQWISLESKNKNFEYVWLRMFYVYGEGQRYQSLIPSLIRKIRNKKNIDIKFPFHANDFIHIDDVVDAIFFVYNQKN